MAAMDLKKLAVELGHSAILSALEPNPIQFSRRDEDDVSRIASALQRAATGQVARFQSNNPVNRNAFLCGCLDYTEHLPEEHLIIGYGYRHGSTTRVENLHHAIGGVDSVAMPPGVALAMRDHYERKSANEIIVFHNHPKNPLNLLVDNLPLASTTDRRALSSLALNLQQLSRTMLGSGRVLFYLGENGFVKQFRLPNLMELLTNLR